MHPKRARVLLLVLLALLMGVYILFVAQTATLSRGSDLAVPAQHLKPSPMPKETPATKILFVFIAIGNVPERLQLIRDNLQALGPKADQGKYHVDCMLFSYASYPKEPEWLHEKEINQRCQVIRLFKTGYIPFLKTLIPSLIKQSGYKYLTISLDDVALVQPHGSFDLPRFYDFMDKYGLSVATPAIAGTSHAGLTPITPKPKQVGRLVKMIEFQSTSFDMAGWECMYELIDTEYPGGWGIDIWFHDYCIASGRIKNGKMGVSDTMKINHNPQGLQSVNNADKLKNWKAEDLKWKNRHARHVNLS